MSDVPLIEIREVTKVYGTGTAAVRALRSVDLRVGVGEFVAIVGPSGAGKTTLLNILGLLERPTSGSYLLSGVEAATLGEADRSAMRADEIGFVFQSAWMLGEESTARNVAIAMEVNGESRAGQETRVEGLLERFALSRVAMSRAAVLSGGERQRAAIARAISRSPRVILADEPTGNLDSANSERVVNELRSLTEVGAAVVMITHDESVAAKADRIVRLADGVLADEALSQSMSRSLVHRNVGPDAVVSRGPAPRPPGSQRIVNLLGRVISGLLAFKPRTLLLVVAFAASSAGLVAALGLSETAAQQITSRLNDASLDEVTVRFPSQWDSDRVSQAIEAIAALPHVIGVGERVDLAGADAQVSRPSAGEARTVWPGAVTGMNSSMADLDQLKLTGGALLSLLDHDEPIAYVGPNVAERLGIPTAGPGVLVGIGGVRVPVAGILESSSRGDVGELVVVNDATADSLAGSVRNVVVRTDPGYPAPVAEAVPYAASPESPEQISTSTAADLRYLARGVSADFTVFIGAMAIAILVLASFAASTTMLINMVARIPEIALRRAVGATRREVALGFLIEGGLQGIAGGALGASFGVVAVVAICAALSWTPRVAPALVLLAVGTCLLTGLISAIIPATRAARIEPAVALRA